MQLNEAKIHEQLQREWGELLTSFSAEPGRVDDWSFVQKHLRSATPALLFAELEDVRVSWEDMLAPAHLEPYAERFVSPSWTVKDLIAHAASWSSELRRQVDTIVEGRTITRGIPYALSVIGPNEWNQIEVEKRRPLNLKRLSQELENATRQMQEFVLDLPEEMLHDEKAFGLAPSGDPTALWRGTIAQVVFLKCGHDRYHMEQVRRLESLIASTS